MKSYTDIEQSRKLAEILPFESADMCYINGDVGKISIGGLGNNVHDEDDIPCWSLAALLSILPNIKLCHYDDSYFCQYMGIGDEFPKYSTNEYNNSIDACYELILKLNELKML